MASNYVNILRKPGAFKFSATGLLARMPMSMVSISSLLAIQSEYHSYTLAGQVSAVTLIAFACTAPWLARRVDIYGQRFMIPFIMASCLAMVGEIVSITFHAHPAALLVCAAIAGGTSGSMGALVRARWSNLLETPDEIHTAFALEAAMDEVAFIVGPILATMLVTNPPLPVTSGLIVAVTAQAVGSLWFLSQRATEPPAKGRTAAQEQTGQSHVLRNGALVVTALTCLVLGGLFGANDVAIVGSATEHGHKNLSGAILACFSTGSLVAALIHGSRQWHWPLQRQFVVGVTVLALGASTLIFAPNLWFVAVAAAITGMAIAPTFTTANQIVQHSVADNQITEGLTWLSTTINVGVSVGTFLAGLAIDNSGAHGGFLAVTVMSWLAVVIAWSGARTLRRTLGVRQIP